MGASFYLEEDLGNIVDEYGNDSMDITENEDLFKLEELSSCSTYIALRAKLVDSEVLQEYEEEMLESVDKQPSGSKQKKTH